MLVKKHQKHRNMLMSHYSDIQSTHCKALGFSDWFALRITKTLRWGADTFFAKRYGNRAIVLETVAAVPGMVGATLSHLRALRLMQDDRGWIRTLMDEAENERMHLMTFIEIAQPSWFERIVILSVQWVFYIFFFFLYLISSKTAHRLVGYFEEEAVLSYTLYLAEIDEGRHPNPPAPAVALRYWNLPEGTTLRDVILIIRADEAHHRDTNHYMANALSGRDADHEAITACPPHVSLDAGLL
jgi:ubiquinol oxidase